MNVIIPSRLLTKPEVCEFLQIDESTLARYEKQGIIRRAKCIKQARYSPKLIAEIMEIDLNEFNPFLLKQEQKKNKELEQENAMLKAKIEQANHILKSQ